MSIFHDVPTPLSFANKKNKIELVKLFKDVPKDIIDGTGACPVQFFAEDKRSEFNWGGSIFSLFFNRQSSIDNLQSQCVPLFTTIKTAKLKSVPKITIINPWPHCFARSTPSQRSNPERIETYNLMSDPENIYGD